MIENDLEAWIAILITCSFADRKLSKSESDYLKAIIFSKQKFQGKAQDAVAAIDKVQAELAIDPTGISLLVGCVGVIPADERETVFACACNMVMIDGDLTESEKSTLATAGSMLQLDDQTIKEIFKVMAIFSKGNIMQQ